MLDVCLLLEGTYPFVSGGVSTWVHQLICAMKDVRFGIVCLSPQSDPTRTAKYDVPNHVLYLKEVFLHEYELEKPRVRAPRKKDFKVVEDFYRNLARKDFSYFTDFVRLFRDETRTMTMYDFFESKKIWDLLVEFNQQYTDQVSFLDFFWTWRATHMPLLQMMQTDLPEAKVYHAVSTGYAGLLGAIMKNTRDCRFFLTEHGIYTHERMLEITQANWIYELEHRQFRPEKELSLFKKWWITLFRIMSKLAYSHADRIFTLYEGNKMREILEGASEEKITIIPNGIDVESFGQITPKKHFGFHVGLIGRVVTIKDIKTYIQAAKRVIAEVSDCRFYIIGPTEEEQEYYEECKLLVETLQLEEKVEFTGRKNVKDYYEILDVVVLTSLSEAQPYVILEANICGLPVVASDVGACREMLEGRTSEDRGLGPSGIVTEVANPDATAEAILRLIKNSDLKKRMGQAGVQRVKKYYDQNDLLSRYLNVYEQNL